MPRYEFKDDKSSKFWEITRSGTDVTTRWGRIGTDGQSKTKSFADEAAATKEVEKMTASKTKKGYVLADDASDGGGDTVTAPGASASNPDLEAAIRANPDDQAVYQVYGDWLQAQGDVHGELVSLQCAMGPEVDGKLRDAEKKIFEAHTETFFGPVHVGPSAKALAFGEWQGYSKPEHLPSHTWHFGYSRTTWRYGFIHQLYFDTGYYEDEGLGGDEEMAAKMLGGMLARPAAAFVREMNLREFWGAGWEDGEGPDMTAAVSMLADAPCRTTLRRLCFLRGDHDISGTSLDASGLARICPNLEELEIVGGNLTVGELEFPKMRRFAARTGGLGASDMKSICGHKMPLIEDLEVWFGTDEYGADCTIEDVAPLLDRTMPNLKRLGLMNAEFGDDICKAVVGSMLLPQLEVLDLTMGIITDEGAQALIAARDKLAHLTKLSIRGYFSADVVTELQTLATDRSVEVEGDMTEDYRYVECSE